MLTRVIRVTVVSLLCWSVVIGSHAIASRADSTGVSQERLGDVTLGKVTEPSELVFGRLTLYPGKSMRVPAVSGSSVHLLVSGTWTVRMSFAPLGPTPVGHVTRSDSRTEAAVDGTPVDGGSSVTVGAGSDVLVPEQTVLEVRNTADVPAVSLAVSLGGALLPAHDNGVQWWPIGDPLVVPAGEVRVELNRLTIAPGGSVARDDTGTIEWVDVSSGRVLLVVNPGQVRITRADGGQESIRGGYEDPSATPRDADEDEGGPGLVSATPGTSIAGTVTSLNIGDGAVITAGGSRALRASRDASAVVLLIGIRVVPAKG